MLTTTDLPATALPATALPATALPATALPATVVPATVVPATALPATALPATALPATVDLTACTTKVSGVELPCWSADPELWFAESPAVVEDAKARCLPCPLREACLAGALARHEPWGVWGGELLVAGVVVARKRPRGRPRKDVALLEGAA